MQTLTPWLVSDFAEQTARCLADADLHDAADWLTKNPHKLLLLEVSPPERVLVLFAMTEEPIVVISGHVIRPKTKYRRPVRHFLVHWSFGVPRITQVESPLILSAGAICGGETFLSSSRATPDDRNGIFVDDEGHILRELRLGDAIEELAVDQNESIWIARFDEGIARGERAITRIDKSGTQLSLPPDLPYIEDVYAMNVHGRTCWFYAYPHFGLTKCTYDRCETWASPVRGATAIAVHREYVLFVGDYESGASATLARCVGRGEMTVSARFRIELPSGRPCDAVPRRGVGSRLFFFDSGQLFELLRWWEQAADRPCGGA